MKQVECRIEHGVQRWFIVGTDILHREDGPAIIWLYGLETWMQNGLVHRIDGPAIVTKHTRKWFINGVLHRIDGPAIIEGDEEEFWVNGTKYTPEDYRYIIFTLYKKQVTYDKKLIELLPLRTGISAI